MNKVASLPGALVISLDFELRWGVRDHCPRGSAYERNLIGAREVVHRTLDMFEEYGVAGTWATVGFLFAGTRADLHEFKPTLLPTYTNRNLDPYSETIGDNEEADPLHYAKSLVARIRQTPRQEIATHTYSHYFCGEAGQTPAQFAADLDSAIAIAAGAGIPLRSIVFPRNQQSDLYRDVLLERGIVAYRGNPHSWMWHFSDAEESGGVLKRIGRLMDAYLPLSGDGSIGWDEVSRPGGLADVRASFLVRPYVQRLRKLEAIRLRRLTSALRSAAERRRIIHLWWHPHNFGAQPDQCLHFLKALLDEYARCRDRLGMQSLSMLDVSEAARSVSSSRPELTRGRSPVGHSGATEPGDGPLS